MLIDKVSFRKDCKKKLQKSAKIAKFYKDQKVRKNLKYLMKMIRPKRVLLYLPIGFEADISTFIKEIRKKCDILVPFMEGVSFKIVKYRLPLKKNKFSIKEPANSFVKHKRIDVAIVPVLGVGRGDRRVGFGKGMYDRFFANLDYRPIIIFVQIEKCYDKKVSTDTFDIQSDYYVTPKKIYITRGKGYADRNFNSRSGFGYRRSSRGGNPKKIGSIQI